MAGRTKKIGRGPLRSLGIRASADLVAQIERLAAENGRSIAMECQLRLAASLRPVPDMSALIREEIRAALAERAQTDALDALTELRGIPKSQEHYRY